MHSLLLRIFLLAGLGYCSEVKVQDASKLQGKALVDFVNSHQTSWKAELSERFDKIEEGVKTGLMGVKNVQMPSMRRQDRRPSQPPSSLPSHFDARRWWPECPSIGLVRDQSSCGSCWAMGAAEAISDRICIASKGLKKVNISAAHLLSCCADCGEGCEGGVPLDAWHFYVKEGIVTGSGYHDKAPTGCQPYPFPPCEHGRSNDTKHFDMCGAKLFSTPSCTNKCATAYGDHFEKDKHYGLAAYELPENEETIKKELMRYGPIEVTFAVFADFFHYKRGVYQHTGGPFVGGHAVKLIGWGVDSGTPYWLLVNSWNGGWGDGGYFKMTRGVNECGIEGGAVAGIPKI